MNLTQLQASIQAKGYPSDTASAAQQLDALNGAYREICGMQRWPFLEKQDATLVTVAGTPDYTVPMTDWRSLDAVRIELVANSWFADLEYAEPQDFRDMEHIDRDTARPAYWTWINQQLRFYPTPDANYTVRIDYVMQPPDLAVGADVPVVPLVYHDVLVWSAIEAVAYRERDWLGRQFAETKKEAQLKRMEDEYLIRQRQSSSHVKQSGYWNSKRYPFAHSGW